MCADFSIPSGVLIGPLGILVTQEPPAPPLPLLQLQLSKTEPAEGNMKPAKIGRGTDPRSLRVTAPQSLKPEKAALIHRHIHRMHA